MSRPVAGVRQKTVIITLPGSPKGATENLRSVIKMLPHACSQAAGANSRTLHSVGMKKLEADAGFPSDSQSSDPNPPTSQPKHRHGCGRSHGHGHDHPQPVRHTQGHGSFVSNDPALGPTSRHRSSPYPMISVEEALALIQKHVPPPKAERLPICYDSEPGEKQSFCFDDENVLDLILAEDVQSKEDIPGFRASIVDGYAVVAPENGDMRGTFPVTLVSQASPSEVGVLKRGEVARITTGAPLPLGATAVIMVEDTKLISTSDDGREEREVEILAQGVKEGDNVREIGSDIKNGSVILTKGERLSGVGGEIGLLAATGEPSVLVYRRPKIAILSTGDELVVDVPVAHLKPGQVRDSNRVALAAAVKRWGFSPIDVGILRDTAFDIEKGLRLAASAADVIVTTGGVSMGELDLLKPTIERTLGGTIHFGRVNMKPGKPTTFATASLKKDCGERRTVPLFALPGNPASALVAFHLFVLPALHHMSGVKPAGLPKAPVVLAHDVPLDMRPEYHRAVVSVDPGGLLVASSTGGQRSSRVGSLRAANALLCLPSGTGNLDRGGKVDALLMGAVRMEES